MKLSVAIRKGAKLHPQGHELFGKYNQDNSEFFTCAVGAAYEAITGIKPPVSGRDAGVRTTVSEAVRKNIDTVIVANPLDGEEASLFDTITFLNDRSNWTREHIADWLETLGY